VALPPALLNAVGSEVEHFQTARISRAAEKISSDYEAGKFDSSLASAEARAAYLVTRLPATYAANLFVFHELQRLVPDFQPHSLLDLGAGPGTSSWAATEAWSSISEAILIEGNRELCAMGKRLTNSHPVLNGSRWVQGDLRSAAFPPADLVVLSYAIGELADFTEIIRRAWSAAQQILVVIEPGTPRNFEKVARIRQELIGQGGHIVAPCPHNERCPMWTASDWCHFAVRLVRTAEHRRMKRGELGYEDEKLSYLAFAKESLPHAQSRIVRHPLVRSGHIQLTLCEASGLVKTTITRSRKDAFRAARKAKWGDEWNQFE
jgi:ribosomal protein RSM22 (predicted rRNA methylase)